MNGVDWFTAIIATGFVIWTWVAHILTSEDETDGYSSF